MIRPFLGVHKINASPQRLHREEDFSGKVPHEIIMLVAHSRNPYVGERKIVVALGDLVSK